MKRQQKLLNQAQAAPTKKANQLERVNLVKFQEYYVKKPYKRREKRYRCILLRIPKRFHGMVDSFMGLDLDMKDIIATESGDERILDIVLAIKQQAVNKQIEAQA